MYLPYHFLTCACWVLYFYYVKYTHKKKRIEPLFYDPLVCVPTFLFVRQVTVGADDLTANYRVEQHVEVVEERERDGKLLRLLATCHKTR